ncbi:class II fumarate hydratase [Oenococcus oeni]|uniref:Fumarate hydratase class II n=3 Tax=Oenococcus oeni TaxID=1247 RepID=A0AAQ2UTJ2_OENOE|nr:class II fumarate hydratase [Oenococcus oeni]MDV7687560.1 class II fumarate hydratase [Oenococcus oeni]OIL40027.1 class II fumarate hydratase [Oenococcus oeni]OIM26318.1 class II fumarate hydratase [Oenococcus oeni]OIM26741.1 class II fumarate hydratase [Oenococcus oeni]OIM28764.1 class II fumarate hydratase [Oenococcus oeni]
MDNEKYRIEKDTLGEVKIPASALWGPQTERSRQNFKIGQRMPFEIIESLLQIKKAAAVVNEKNGEISKEKSNLIVEVIDQLLVGKYQDAFPLVVYQTGSGTQTNMNVNEVIVHLAAEINPKVLLQANDDVNHSQSSNDTFPTAMAIAAYDAVKKLLSVLEHLENSLNDKALEFKNIVKIGRTHLQDATPITFGQEISGWSSQIKHNFDYLQNNKKTLLELPIGGTAVGTGLNTVKDFDRQMVEQLSVQKGISYLVAPNKFQGLAAHSAINFIHGIFKTLAADLVKIGNDIRFLASGPRSGYGEINIPANEPGSSIMPGKINPTQIEALTMVAARVMGNDTTIDFSSSQGNFEMNVYKPIIIQSFLESAKLLTEAIGSVDKNLIQGITVNQKRMKDLVDNSLMTVTALSPHIGYEKSAKIAQKALRENTKLIDAALASGYVTEKEFREWVDPFKMTSHK